VELSFNEGKDTVVLSMPESEKSLWWDVAEDKTVDRTTVKPKSLDSLHGDDIKFMIFQPSVGRAQDALLDLSGAMAPFGKASRKYNQIIVVKRSEEEDYRRCWQNRTLLVLPESADGLGVGASRYWIQTFAAAMDPEFPFIFVLDDSVHYWKRA
jgi:hypothetical protein